MPARAAGAPPSPELCAAPERVWPATRPELSVPGHVAIDVRSHACLSAHRPRTLHCLRDHLALRLRWSSVLVAARAGRAPQMDDAGGVQRRLRAVPDPAG